MFAQASRTEITILRSEAQAARASIQTKANALEERIELLQVFSAEVGSAEVRFIAIGKVSELSVARGRLFSLC